MEKCNMKMSIPTCTSLLPCSSHAVHISCLSAESSAISQGAVAPGAPCTIAEAGPDSHQARVQRANLPGHSWVCEQSCCRVTDDVGTRFPFAGNSAANGA